MRLIKRKLLINLGGTTERTIRPNSREEWFFFNPKYLKKGMRIQMEENLEEKIEEFKKKEEQERKKKRRKKEILIFLLIIIVLIGLYASTVIVKRMNIAKLGNELCEYNGEHPIQTGMKEELHSMCKGCSKIMDFETAITDELCDTCAQEFNRCKRCGKLLEN